MDISVIIPYFNSLNIIERTVQSIKNQTYLPKEVIIVDDFSDVPLSLDSLGFSNSTYTFELKIVSHTRNLGAAAARNTGIKLATGKYIAFLDSDDCWLDDKLEKQIHAIGTFDFLYSNYCESFGLIDRNNNPLEVKKVDYLHILNKNLSPVTLLAKKESIIFFDERFRRCDDFKMSIEALALNRKIGYLDIDVAYGFKKAIGGGGLTGSLLKMSLSFIKACIIIIYERPRLFFKVIPFLIFELIKFPIRCLKVYILR